MLQCCLFCKFPEAYWVSGLTGEKNYPPPTSFGDMNMFCQHPQKSGCYRISYTNCTHFLRDTEDRIRRRIKFFSQFKGWKVQSEIIGLSGEA